MAIRGSCHCGKTRFEVREAPTSLTSCNCTFCTKRGALWANYTSEQFELLTPRDDVATYQPNLNAHHFCATCGCGTFSETPNWDTGEPDFSRPKIGVNARLFDDFDLEQVPVEHLDGRNLW